MIKLKLKNTIVYTALGVLALYMNPWAIKESYACSRCAIERAVNRQGSNIRSTIREQASRDRVVIDKARQDIVNAIGQLNTGVSTAVSESTKSLGEDRAASDKSNQSLEAIKDRPQKINCGNVGSSSAPPQASSKGGGAGGNYSGRGGGSSSALAQSQKAVAMTNQDPKLEDIPPTDVSVAWAGIGACETYAGTFAAELCQNAGIQTKQSEYENAHIDGNTLIYGPQRKSDPKKVKRNSIKPDSEEHTAMMTNMQMLFETRGIPTLSKSEMETSEGKQFLGDLFSWLASKNLARQSAQNIIDENIAVNETIPALKEIMKTDGEWLTTYLRDQEDWQSGVSPALMRDIEADRRAANPRWAGEVHSLTDAERQTESLFMQAKSLQFQRDIIERLNTTNLLLGKIVEMQAQSDHERILRTRERAIEQSVDIRRHAQESAQGE